MIKYPARQSAVASTTREQVDLVVLGSSGHTREILAIADAVGGHRVIGCVGPFPDSRHRHLVPWLGEDEWLATAPPGLRYVVGIGSGGIRARVDTIARRTGRRAAILVHPGADAGARTTLGEGCIVWPGVVVTTDVTLGRHVHLGAKVSVGHDAHLDDFVTLLPGSTVAGCTRVGAEATVGAGATIIDGISVGPRAIVGAGAVVVRDVPADSVVMGVPARVTRFVGPPGTSAEQHQSPEMKGPAWDEWH